MRRKGIRRNRKSNILYNLLILSLVIAIILTGKSTLHKLSKLAEEQNQPELSIEQQAKLIELEKFKAEQSQKNKKEEAKKQKELADLSNPIIIKNKLVKQGNIKFNLDGKTPYEDIIEEKGFLSYKMMKIALKYKYTITYDLKNIDVRDIELKGMKRIVIQIPRDKFIVQGVELQNGSMFNTEKYGLTKGYSAQDIIRIQNIATNKIKKDILSDDKEMFSTFRKLEAVLETQLKQFGYKQVLLY